MPISRMSKESAVRMLCVIALAGGVAMKMATAQTSTPLSKQEAKQLIATAKTPEDHARLAAYYRSESGKLSTESQRYEKLARFLDTQAKRGSSPSSATSYRQLAQEDARKAKEYESMAATQDQLGKETPATEAKK